MRKVTLLFLLSLSCIVAHAQLCSGFLANISVTGGTFPSEVSWQLKNGSTVLMSGEAPVTGQVCLPNLCQNYTLLMFDTFGDGWNGAVFTLSYGTWSTSTTLNGGSSGSSLLYAGFSGCTDPFACNYNSAATCNSGCIYGFTGCTDPDACNFEPLACFNNGTCCYGNCVLFTMTDSFGDGWNGGTYSILNASNAIVYSGTLSSGSSGVLSFCLASGCYTIVTTGGSFPGEIGWSITGQIQGGNLSGGAPGSIKFNTADVQSGCTDEFACNYNPSASCEDGSCYYGFGGCTDPSSCAFEPLACIDDGSCDDYTTVDLRLHDESLNGWSGKQLAFFQSGSTEPVAIVSMPNGYFFYDLSVCIPNGCYTLQDISSEVNDPDGYIEFLSSPGEYNINSLLLGQQFGTVVSGCTFEGAANFNPNANCTDYQCCFEKAGYVSLSGLNAGESVTLSLYYGGELYEEIVLSSNVEQQFLCLPEGCLTYIWTVPVGIHISWTLEGDGFGSISGSELEHTGGTVVGLPIGGCNDTLASNYNPFACYNDGSCCYGTTVEVYVSADGSAYPYDETVVFQLINENNEVVIYSELLPGQTTNAESFSMNGLPQYCLPDGCYTYTFSGSLTEYYVVFDISLNHSMSDVLQDQQGTVYIGDNWPEEIGFENEEFALGAGCTDPEACNYISYVICDDGSCTYGTTGCTNPVSCAYDPLACFDDGTCDDFIGLTLNLSANTESLDYFNGLTIHSKTYPYENLFYPISDIAQQFEICLPVGCYDIYGYMDAGENWMLSGTNEGTLMAEGFDYGPFSFSVGSNLVSGCTNPAASNYVPDATCDLPGDCCFGETLSLTVLSSTPGIEVGFHLYFNGELYQTYSWTNSAWEEHLCLPNGCAQIVPFAGSGGIFDWFILDSSGQDYSGNQGSSSFDIVLGNSQGGCLDPQANNYSPIACFDDGSCCYGRVVDLVFSNAYYSGEPGTLEIRNEMGELVYQIDMIDDVNYLSERICLPNGCYSYEIISPSNHHILALFVNSPVHNLEEWLFTYPEYSFQQVGPGTFPIGGTNGCTDPTASNYSPTAVCDNGTCIIPGCMDPSSCNFNPLANLDNGTCSGGNPLNFVFSGLTIPESATVNIYDALGQILIYTQQVDAVNSEVSFCLYSPGCYTYHVVPNSGSTYSFTVTGMLEGVFTGNQLSGLTGISTYYAIADCADPTASNYYQHSCSDNGFCCQDHYVILEIYPLATSAGIENVTTSIYDWDGNLIFQLESNMSASHQSDYYGLCLEDGCFFYTSSSEEAFSEYGIRFTDHDRNYPGTAIDIIVAQGNMGVAEFMQIGTIVPGCANPGACNYNPDANCDDNTCSTSCIGDLDCSGGVGIGDLLIFAAHFGCSGDCGISDLNQDGFVNTTDLLIFISKFGLLCP